MIEGQLLHARTLIGTLHKSPNDFTLIEITGMAPKRKPIKRYFTNADVAAEFAVETTNHQFNVFVSANARSAMTGFEQDVPFVTALPLDLQPERTNINTVAETLARGGIPPTITVVSGYGAHFYLTVEPAPRDKAKIVAERLVKFTFSDPIHNVNRIMRCAGTLNWKKTPARWCYLTHVAPERHYTIEQIDKALDRLGAGPARVEKDGIPVPINPPMDWLALRERLSPGVLDIIDTGERNAYSEKQVSRSEADWLVICALVRAGAPDEMIYWVYERQPVGIMKYRSTGAHYLNRTIESARRATADVLNERPVTRTISYPKINGSARDTSRNRALYW